MDGPDDLSRKKIDYNSIKKMSYDMNVPDIITVGAYNSSIYHHPHNDDPSPVPMVVPERIRFGDGDNSKKMLYETDDPTSNESNHLLKSPNQQSSLPSDSQSSSDDGEYSTIDTPSHIQQQPPAIADTWQIEPSNDINDNILNNLQSLQNRVHHIERTLVRRNFRDRVLYTCVIGYFLLQTLFSVRRSMLN